MTQTQLYEGTNKDELDSPALHHVVDVGGFMHGKVTKQVQPGPDDMTPDRVGTRTWRYDATDADGKW